MKNNRHKVDRLIEIISALRWAVVAAIPLTFVANLSEHTGSNMGLTEVIKSTCVLISTASFIMCAIIKSKDSKTRVLNISAAVGLLVGYAVTLR